MDMRVFFPGNKRVYADYKGFTIETDQPVGAEGDGSAPAPFDLFLASLGTCAGIYVLGFMQQRGLSTEGAGLTLRTERDPDTNMLSRVDIQIILPPNFPEKYKDAVIRAADLCAVKRHIDNPPAFTISTAIS
jgi:putative redox protein